MSAGDRRAASTAARIRLRALLLWVLAVSLGRLFLPAGAQSWVNVLGLASIAVLAAWFALAWWANRQPGGRA